MVFREGSMTTETVWLLFNQQDYESKELHSVYEDKPDEDELFIILDKEYSHAFDPEVINLSAYTLYNEERVRMLSLYTWTLEQWEVR
jgi:hypothetical protein